MSVFFPNHVNLWSPSKSSHSNKETYAEHFYYSLVWNAVQTEAEFLLSNKKCEKNTVATKQQYK